ncbi:YceI family protein [Sphingobium subterraneum]|uniref:Polyisoprenoid-binding protein YceI n=1 Tax=Sphingobium subterraneum TaxID=627688 RepID=A0A841IYD7_9SPHN|nr:YceI family protein [Sphingobium subterraneum]MBB6123424.1 polyisoprenoid-binding protein YceI [Sphingobium subterraneum]
MTPTPLVRIIAGFALSALTWAPLPGEAKSPAVWKMNSARSKVEFRSSFGGDAFTGQFKRWNARILFDPTDLAHSSVAATIDLASAATGDSSRDTSLPEKDWFYVAKFPTAKFVSTSFRALGGNRYEAAGTLEIRGIKKPLKLPFQLDIKGNVAVMRAQVAVNRLLFGVGQGQFADPQSIPANVAVNLIVTAQK